MIDFDEIRQQLDLLNEEELLSILREHDEEQWRPEVFDIVASILRERGVSPSKDTEHSENVEDLEAEITGADLVTVAGYFNSADAEADLMALEQKGLRGWIFDENAPHGDGQVSSVQLKVFEEDFRSAIAILNSETVSSSDLPDEIAEPPCPKCGSREITEESEIVESFNDSLRPNRSTPEQVWLYRCGVCGYQWSAS